MKTAAIREKLYDYIRVADDKKVQAIFVMLEEDITEQVKWWNDNVFVSDLEKRYKAWETGKEKGYTLAEVEASIDQLRKKCNIK
jgi:membrane carboxypeptidase/penicillin-binding protein PbpC